MAEKNRLIPTLETLHYWLESFRSELQAVLNAENPRRALRQAFKKYFALILKLSKKPNQESIYSTENLQQHYDYQVIEESNPKIWQCPTEDILDLYANNLTASHLDIGPGTGYYLANCDLPQAMRLALLDTNSGSLETASQRLESRLPETYEHNILKPLTSELVQVPKFKSISLNYVLHCLPYEYDEEGQVILESKYQAVDHITELLQPGGIIFGSTIIPGKLTIQPTDKSQAPLGNAEILAKLQELLDNPKSVSNPTEALLNLYNQEGIFHNKHDTLKGLQRNLKQRFSDVKVWQTGQVVFFRARKKTTTYS